MVHFCLPCLVNGLAFMVKVNVKYKLVGLMCIYIPNVSCLRWYLGRHPAIISLFHLFDFEKETKL